MSWWRGVACLSAFLLCAVAARAQSAQPLPDYSKGPSTFPRILKPYRPSPVPPVELANSERLPDLIRHGRLQLSLSQALALAIENNLDIEVQRFVHPIAQADLLRTASGQAARGIPGALLPAGLSAGALGVGVNQAGGTGGVGSAGGISGGGGAVSVPQVGTFDPAVSVSASWDRTTAPLNSVVVAGVPQVTTSSAATSLNYTQLFSQGASVTMTANGIAQDSTQQSLLFNPAVVSRVVVGVNQPLLNGFGFLPNERFMMVASNNLTTSDQVFREQVTTVIVEVEDAYWNLAAARMAIDVAQRTADAAKELVRDTEARVQIGTAAGLDVVTASSAAAAAERDLIVAQTNLQQQEAQLKSYLSKTGDPLLDASRVETTDALPEPDGRAVPAVDSALSTAMENRPELRTAQQDLRNQDISVRFTNNGLLPALSVFGLYAGAGLNGDTLAAQRGLGSSLDEALNASYPEYSVGMSATIPLRNRSAQADNVRAKLEEQQLQVQLQRSRQQIGLEVRQAIIGLLQGKAQVEAAHEALRLAERTAQAERDKLQLGVTTAYDVILRERDLAAAQQADLTASAGYARALVEFERATGTTLENNGITTGDALYGHMGRTPDPAILHPTPVQR